MANKKVKMTCHTNPDKVVNLVVGDKYWTFYKNPHTNFVQVLETTYKADRTDLQRIKEDKIFATQKEAKAASEK